MQCCILLYVLKNIQNVADKLKAGEVNKTYLGVETKGSLRSQRARQTALTSARRLQVLPELREVTQRRSTGARRKHVGFNLLLCLQDILYYFMLYRLY